MEARGWGTGVFGQDWVCALILWWLPNSFSPMSVCGPGGIVFFFLCPVCVFAVSDKAAVCDHVIEAV